MVNASYYVSYYETFREIMQWTQKEALSRHEYLQIGDHSIVGQSWKERHHDVSGLVSLMYLNTKETMPISYLWLPNLDHKHNKMELAYLDVNQ